MAATGKVAKRSGLADRQAARVVGLLFGLIGEGGELVRTWAAGGIEDQPADLWETAQALGQAVAKYYRRQMKKGRK